MKSLKDHSPERTRETTAGAHKVPTAGNRCPSAHDRKVCEYCHGVFERPDGKSHSRWVKQRFCNKSCAASAPRKPRGPYFASMEKRFHSQYAPEPNSGCWLWLGSLSSGYGKFTVGKERQAHRVSYVLHVGPIPEGLEIDHLCRTRQCVNPDHLEAVTAAENNRRAAAAKKLGLLRWPRGIHAPAADIDPHRGSHRPSVNGELNGRARLQPDDVRRIRAAYAEGGTSCAKLADEYGVSKGAVSDIIRRKNWRHLK